MALARQDEDRQFHLKVEEVKLQYLVGATMAAAGSKKGAKQAQRIRLTRKEKGIASFEQVAAKFGAQDWEENP